MKDYILGLDFDGVLWDSVGECFLCAHETLKQDFHREVREDGPVVDAFRRGRWLVRTGGDFLLVYDLAVEDPSRDLELYSKKDFQALRDSNHERVADFEKKFYARRETLRENQTEEWLASQQPYPEVVAQFAALKEAFGEVVLLTTKDAPSAKMLLKSAHIELPMWSRENGVDKGEQVKDLCQKRQHTPDKVLLIDDLMENLDQVGRFGTPGFLADWGYNTERERQAARKHGYPVLAKSDLLRQLQVWADKL